ncbi:MAG: hypothetical protein QM778_04025 [Myxococcales bacterium]
MSRRKAPQRTGIVRRLGCSALVTGACMISYACGPSFRPEAHLANERSFLRLGVELDKEEQAVRHVLAQRKLLVAAEVRGPAFIALGASTLDTRLSAIRVISPRGVIVAEDAAHDDLFAPAELQLFDRFPTMVDDYAFVAWTRIPYGRDLGCASLYRILPDLSAVAAVLDVSTVGPRACIAELTRAGDGQMSARLAFPGLYAGQTPSLMVQMSFQKVPLGREPPLVPVAKIASGGPWLEAERTRLEALLRPSASLEERHALGVARAAVALLAGLDTEAQVAAYRSSIGRVMPGSAGAMLVAETLDYLEDGWSEAEPPPAGEAAPDAPRNEDSLVIEPGQGADAGGPAQAPAHEDALIIEPPTP